MSTATPTRPAIALWTPTSTAIPPSPTAPAVKLEAPTLLEPLDGATFVGARTDVTFRWSEASRPLGPDEYYVLIIHHREGDDFTWTKEPIYSVGDDKRWLSELGAELKWQVVIARQRTGEPNEAPTGAELSDYSETRILHWTQGDGGGDGGDGGPPR